MRERHGGALYASATAEPPRWRGRHARPAWRRRALGIVLLATLAATISTDIIPARHAQAWEIEENHTISVAGEYGNALFTPSNSRIAVTQSNQVDQQALQIHVMDLNYHPTMDFTFSTRDGSNEYFKVGYYGDAQRYPFADPGRPGIDIGSLGFCSDQRGNYEVREIVRDGPRITRIWITYQRYCNNALPADIRPSFGEIRLGYPKTSYDVSPRVVRWPAGTYPKRSSYDVPVTVRPTGSTAVTVKSVSIDGPTPSSFPIRRHNCTGVLSATGCVVWVGFVPTSPGPRYARLIVATSAGTTTVTLDGSGALGTSDWGIDVNYADIGRADERLTMPYAFSWGDPYRISSQAVQSDGLLWQADFTLPTGQTFAQGGHYVWKADGTGLRVSLSRGNNGCEVDRATLDIANLAYTGPDKRLSLLDATMSVHCRSNSPYTVSGRIRFHDRTDLKGPFRVSNVRAVRDGGYVNLSWTNPPSADFARTVVRWYPGDVGPGAPDVGTLARFGATNTVRIAAPSTKPVAISIWTFDTTGNSGLRYGLVVNP
jgi:hypothetical protein